MSQPFRIGVMRLGAALLLLALASCGGAEGSPVASGIQADELDRRIREGAAPFILDVRTPEEYAAGHIPGAVLIPYDELESRLTELAAAPSDEIVIHCKTGRRAEIAGKTLAIAGYTQVRPLEGHIVGWQQGGHPMETATQ
jgi:rhodanese-related sulfurtransferase